VLFVEYRFIFFFLIVFAVNWTLRSNRSRKLWLLVMSYVFYGAWDWRFLSLIWISTVVDYLIGLGLEREDREGRRRLLIVISLVVNLGLLGFFKYFGFFVDSAEAFLAFLGLPLQRNVLEIVLPVGISFYTFQTLSYSIDVYRRKLKATHNFLDLALFVGFFPQLVAGPIVRAADFLPQLQSKKFFANVEVRAALLLFLIGFIKKAVVADNVAVVSDLYFQQPGTYTALSSWLAVGSYAVQIYCDFSGYSDMAIACAGLLGFRLPLNFNFPYFAENVTVFWRRWHISLSTWLRDYLYIPLGGSHGSRLFTYRNLMLTMLLGGLWHGAAWRFVIWGGLHGIALIMHRQWDLFRARLPAVPQRLQPLTRVVAVLVTFYWVCLAWVYFRAPDMATAWVATKAFLLIESPGSVSLRAFQGRLEMGQIALVLVGLAVVHFISNRGVFRRLERVPPWLFALGYGVATRLVLGFVPQEATPFIYFQF
jgi:alginate O-acetyltransferase complex protein AlgI